MRANDRHIPGLRIGIIPWDILVDVQHKGVLLRCRCCLGILADILPGKNMVDDVEGEFGRRHDAGFVILWNWVSHIPKNVKLCRRPWQFIYCNLSRQAPCYRRWT